MAIAPLHVQVKSGPDQTFYDIHHFIPTVRASSPSPLGARYDYVVLYGNKYDSPTQVRIFVDHAEVLELYDQLTPIVEKWRAGQLEVAAAGETAPV